MLPLWIIDLNQDELMREKLSSRISQLGKDVSEYWTYSHIDKAVVKKVNEALEDSSRQDSEEDLAKKEESHPNPNNDSTEDNLELGSDEWSASFAKNIISLGQKFVENLYSGKPVNDGVLNICVIGNVSERTTLRLFTSVAALIKRLKSKIVPSHIHVGINIIGMLYVPYNINKESFYYRQMILRCFKELHIQHKVNSAAGYDKVMLFQDTQHRMEKVYGKLDNSQILDYIFQCLLHLYYVCDNDHPLIEGNNSNDDFFFSMGVGSLYYDTKDQDNKDAATTGNNLFATLKLKGKQESELVSFDLLSDNGLMPQSLINQLWNDIKPDENIRNKVEMTSPQPHPISDFMDDSLKRRFYGLYLPNYVEKLQRKIVSSLDRPIRFTIEKVNEILEDKLEKIKATIKNDIGTHVKSFNSQNGSIPMLKIGFVNFKKEMQDNRESLYSKDTLKESYWENVFSAHDDIKHYLIDYNAAYLSDAEEEQDTSRCDEMKNEAAKGLVSLLSNDSTILSRIGRAFLAGIVMVFAIVPLIELLSPNVINLGNVKSYSYVWGTLVFLIPMLLQYISFRKFHKKRKNYESALEAYYLHDAYAKLANRELSQIEYLYEQLIDLADKYISRCDKILETNDELFAIDKAEKGVIPITMFNMPLMGGKIADEEIFPDKSIDINTLKIDEDRIKLDHMKEHHYFTLIRKFNNDIAILFDNIEGPNPVNTNIDGSVTIMSKEQIDAENNKIWQDAKDKFVKNINTRIKELFVPRADKTVADKLLQYANDPVNNIGFEKFVKFCSTNGEFTTNDNDIFGDIKTNNSRIERLFKTYMPMKTTYQTYLHGEPNYDFFNSYLFLTKWRTFNYITALRVLPEDDIEDKDFAINNHFDEGDKNVPQSTLFLYSLIGGTSSEWYQIISPDHFNSLLSEKGRRDALKDNEDKKKKAQEEEMLKSNIENNAGIDTQMNNANDHLDNYVKAVRLENF